MKENAQVRTRAVPGTSTPWGVEERYYLHQKDSADYSQTASEGVMGSSLHPDPGLAHGSGSSHVKGQSVLHTSSIK